MSVSGRSLLVLLQRCVPVRLTVPTAVPVRLSARCGLLQRPTRTGCERRLCRPQSALESSRLGFCTEVKDRQTGASTEDEYPPLPEYQTDEEPEKEFHIVQVKGLPWSCSAQDLVQFFSECRIRDGEKGIHLTVDAQGRPSGRAFIEMEHEADVGKALEKHLQYLGPRFVEVYEVTNRVAEAILKKAHQDDADNWVVRLRGLPFTCTEADVTQFFSGLNISENGITFVTDHGGRKSGEAFVQFSSQESAAGALQRDRAVIGNRYIEVFPSRTDQIHSIRRRKTMTSAFPQTSPRPDLSAPPESSQSSELYYIHMRGLPFQASGEDIVKFFFPLVVSKILIEYGPNGKPSGEADVYFHCHQDAVTAMSKDRMHIGRRYIELFLNSSDSDCR